MTKAVKKTKHILIVEGIDGVGKTALINLIQQKAMQTATYGVARVHVRRLVDNPHKLTEGESLIYAARQTRDWDTLRHNEILIYDRFPVPDDFVYGVNRPNDLYETWIDFLARYQHLTYIYVSPNPSAMTAYREHMLKNPDVHFPSFDIVGVAERMMEKYELFWDLCEGRIPIIDVSWQSFHRRHAEDLLNYLIEGKAMTYGHLRSDYSSEGTAVAVGQQAS